MGAIKFIISETSKNLANIEFTKAMLNMKSRGETETTYTLDSNIPISRINHEQVKKSLTRDQLAKYKNYSVIYGYHRLAINDNSFNASQPFEDPILHKIREYPELRTRVNRRLLCNGEIYNYDTLVAEFSDKDIQSTSDVEIILPLYIKYGLDYVLNKLDGDYTFILTENINTIDLDSMNVFAARDIFGNKPLYYITNKLSEFYMFVTELKGIPQKLLQNNQYTVSEFPIGSYWSFQNPTQFTKFYDWEYLKNLDNCIINSTDPNQINSIYTNIESLLTQSIIKRVKTNVKQPIGILVSGGFDSSIITAIISRYVSQLQIEHPVEIPIELHTFSISENDTLELVEWLEDNYPGLDIIHHTICIDESFINKENLKKVITDNIYITETYDVQTIRDSIPFTLLFKYIRDNTPVKILLSGEGIDELFPDNIVDDALFQSSSISAIQNFNKLDKLERLVSNSGLEIRHPFLDKSLVEYIASIHPKLKRAQVYQANKPPIEKYILRSSFKTSNYLPYKFLWRTRDKINNSYYDKIISIICDLSSDMFTETDLENYVLEKNVRTCNNKPECLESLYYRKTFEKFFGKYITM